MQSTYSLDLLHKLVLPPILGIIVFGTFGGNLLVLLLFLRRVKKYGGSTQVVAPTQYFIANLSLADFLVGTTVLPFLATQQITDAWYFGSKFCNIWVASHFTLCTTSMLSTCAVCVERFIGVRYPLRHLRILRMKHILTSLVVIWLLASVPSIMRIFVFTETRTNDQLYECTTLPTLGSGIFAALWIFYIPAITMLVLYFLIYKVAKRHISGELDNNHLEVHRSDTKTLSLKLSNSSSDSNNSNGHSADGISPNNVPCTMENAPPSNVSSLRTLYHRDCDNDIVQRKQIKVAKKLAVLVGVILVSYGPYFTLKLIRGISPESVNPHLFDFFMWLRYFNSFVNPFIYAFVVPSFNQELRKMLSLKQ